MEGALADVVDPPPLHDGEHRGRGEARRRDPRPHAMAPSQRDVADQHHEGAAEQHDLGSYREKGDVTHGYSPPPARSAMRPGSGTS